MLISRNRYRACCETCHGAIGARGNGEGCHRGPVTDTDPLLWCRRYQVCLSGEWLACQYTFCFADTFYQMDEANEIIGDLLNEQGALLWQWRKQLIALLTKPLSSSEEDDADGQEYTRSLDTQGEAEAYLQAYSALLADRREAMTSERTLLAALDVKEKKLRKTKAAKKANGAIMDGEDVIMTLDEDEQKPEHAVLLAQLQNERKNILESFDSDRSMRSIMVDLNNAAARAKDRDPEKAIATEATKRLRELLKAEGNHFA